MAWCWRQKTAIGEYPVRCAAMIVRMVHEHQNQPDLVDLVPGDSYSSLITPHGGTLVQRLADADDKANATALPRLQVSISDVMDCEQLAHGTFSPLFMDRETLRSVLETNRLPDGTVWTMPVILQIPGGERGKFAAGDRIALSADGDISAFGDGHLGDL